MIGAICDAFESAAIVDDVEPVRCRSAITLSNVGSNPRFAYLFFASPLELVTGEASEILDRSDTTLAFVELTQRLLDGEVAALAAPAGPLPQSFADVGLALPTALVERRQLLRRQNVQARFLLRQIGLEEVSSHRGAHRQLYTDLAALWSHDLSLCTDPAMMLTLGADRQRYVDRTYKNRAAERLPRVVSRFDEMGIRSYPRLVII